ncbi:XRE family transcriptional regulator [Aerococcaceae bacterium NML201209]|nr:XRE family transcriptional regulator [Aerococcaceae bacterium NML201209]
MTEKQKLRVRFLKPKITLRSERKKRELSTAYVANLVGLERRQYEKKEAGEFPFHDYEMAIIAKEFNLDESYLFF